jgi:nucleotide-binding universal stress UspA family protein
MKTDSIVVGVDGSDNAATALSTAADLAEPSGGTVHVVVAYDPMPPDAYRDILAQLPDEFRSTYDPAAVHRGVLDEAMLVLATRDIAREGHLVADHPVSAILDTAEAVDADLIVVGSRGTGWVTRAFRGSVSSRVANHATRNLLVVHEEEPAD